jgi:LCP family protein required for cell wall assembly
MKTTLKRGVGRGAHLNGNGHAVFPPGTISSVNRYEQPPPPGRSGLGLLARILVGTLLIVVAASLAVGGGAYLWFHQSVAAVRAHSADVKTAQKQLDVTLPGQAAIALVLGYDKRKGVESAGPSRSDTVMLLRADPQTKTISMLSFPRDLIVPVYCKSGFVANDRINSAYARCGSTGTLDTVRNLTKLPINYLITVNFHGFKQIVDDLGGLWMDVDRRYYNKNVGTYSTNFANINLQPGYQRLSGGSALDFVRYRHTDSDLYRLARQQQFVRAFKEQVSQHFSVQNLPSIVSAITHNVEVGAKSNFGDRTVLRYALLAATLPGGHFFQVRIDNITGSNELQAPASSIQNALASFVNPDVTASRVANATALGKKAKLKSHAPSPQQTTVTVLNGNAVAGSAANASYLLAQRGYVTVLPANGAAPNAPIQNYFHSQIYFDPKQKGAKAAAMQLQKVIAPSDVRPLPKSPGLRALDPGSMLLLVTGETFHNDLTAPVPVTVIPKRQPANVRYDTAPGHQLLDPLVKRVPFTLELPTILERSSVPDTLPGDKPSRLYYITRGHKAVRLTFRTGGNEFWGIQETDWKDAPVLADRSFMHNLGGREFQLYYSGAHLHMVVLAVGDRSYWVVNTLLDSLSNETMLAIAKGLKPMKRGK